MKIFNRNLLCMLCFAIVLVTSCKKDNNNESSVTYQAPKAAATATLVKVPTAMQTSSNQYASMANGYVELANAYSGTLDIFNNIPSDATKGTIKSSGSSWTWSDNQGNSIYIEFTEGTTEYTWKLYMKTAAMASRALVISATELKTGLGGTLLIYDIEETSATAVVTYTWTKSANGSVSATLLLVGTDGSFYFVITSNSDGSGTVKVYEGSSASGLKFIDITWTSAGTGTWWVKDLDTGQEYSGAF